MTRPRDLKQLTRPHRLQLKADHQLADDLDRIGEAWKVPTSTAIYWLLRGLMADARSETFVIAGDTLSEKLGRWLVRHYPKDIGE